MVTEVEVDILMCKLSYALAINNKDKIQECIDQAKEMIKKENKN